MPEVVDGCYLQRGSAHTKLIMDPFVTDPQTSSQTILIARDDDTESNGHGVSAEKSRPGLG